MWHILKLRIWLHCAVTSVWSTQFFTIAKLKSLNFASTEKVLMNFTIRIQKRIEFTAKNYFKGVCDHPRIIRCNVLRQNSSPKSEHWVSEIRRSKFKIESQLIEFNRINGEKWLWSFQILHSPAITKVRPNISYLFLQFWLEFKLAAPIANCKLLCNIWFNCRGTRTFWLWFHENKMAIFRSGFCVICDRKSRSNSASE